MRWVGCRSDRRASTCPPPSAVSASLLTRRAEPRATPSFLLVAHGHWLSLNSFLRDSRTNLAVIAVIFSQNNSVVPWQASQKQVLRQGSVGCPVGWDTPPGETPECLDLPPFATLPSGTNWRK